MAWAGNAEKSCVGVAKNDVIKGSENSEPFILCAIFSSIYHTMI